MARLRYEVVVVGSGPAGSSIASRLARKGKRVALVEAEGFGGTCALRGCNPKKVLVNAAEVLQSVRDADQKLAGFPTPRPIWSLLARFKDSFVEPVSPKTAESMEGAGVDLVSGRARFVDRETLQVAGDSITAQHVVLATGARPATLDIPGASLLTTSDRFLDLEELPARILFVGGGYISMEFAHVTVRFGAAVTIVEREDTVLNGFEPDLSKRLVDHTAGLGVDLLTGLDVVRVDRTAEGLAAEYSNGETGTFDLIVHGAGRVPNLDGLALEKGGVEFSKRGISVNAQMRSPTNPMVYAVGDCAASAGAMLTPIANAHAHAVVRALSGEDPDAVPDITGAARVVFTVPALASVGLLTAEARNRDLDFEVCEGDMSQWNSVRKLGAGLAAYKLLFVRGSGECLGAHLLGPRAEETINLFSLAMRGGMTRADRKAAPLAFPTFGHEVREMV